jgi:hypothetical protein
VVADISLLFLFFKHTNRFSFNRFRINNPVLLPTIDKLAYWAYDYNRIKSVLWRLKMPIGSYFFLVVGAIFLFFGIVYEPDNRKDKIVTLIAGVSASIFLTIWGTVLALVHALKGLKIQ